VKLRRANGSGLAIDSMGSGKIRFSMTHYRDLNRRAGGVPLEFGKVLMHVAQKCAAVLG
jgi:hypothetical protein